MTTIKATVTDPNSIISYVSILAECSDAVVVMIGLVNGNVDFFSCCGDTIHLVGDASVRLCEVPFPVAKTIPGAGKPRPPDWPIGFAEISGYLCLWTVARQNVGEMVYGWEDEGEAVDGGGEGR